MRVEEGSSAGSSRAPACFSAIPTARATGSSPSAASTSASANVAARSPGLP